MRGCGEGRVDEVDVKLSFDDVEELVLVLMFVPVVVAFDDAEADDGVVYVAEGFVVPGLYGVGGELFFDQLEGFIFGFEDGGVGGVGGHDGFLSANGLWVVMRRTG